MTSGAMLMKDYLLYTDTEFICMCGYMFICIVGVIMLVYKIKWFNRLFINPEEIALATPTQNEKKMFD